MLVIVWLSAPFTDVTPPKFMPLSLAIEDISDNGAVVIAALSEPGNIAVVAVPTEFRGDIEATGAAAIMDLAPNNGGQPLPEGTEVGVIQVTEAGVAYEHRLQYLLGAQDYTVLLAAQDTRTPPPGLVQEDIPALTFSTLQGAPCVCMVQADPIALTLRLPSLCRLHPSCLCVTASP